MKRDYILPISLKGPHCRPEDSDSDRGAGPRGGRDNRQRERGAECGRARQRRGGVREAPKGERGLVVGWQRESSPASGLVKQTPDLFWKIKAGKSLLYYTEIYSSWVMLRAIIVDLTNCMLIFHKL